MIHILEDEHVAQRSVGKLRSLGKTLVVESAGDGIVVVTLRSMNGRGCKNESVLKPCALAGDLVILIAGSKLTVRNVCKHGISGV